MGQFLLNIGAKIMCPHGGQVKIVPSNMRVKLSGKPIAVLPDFSPITGCPFTLPGPKPSPCIRVQWLKGAMRIKTPMPPLYFTSKGICLSPESIPQGPPQIIMTQFKVRGT